MNTEEKFAPKGMLKMDLQVNPEGKTAIEVLVDGDFKSLVYLVSTLFKEEPRMYDLMKEAVEFHEFRKSMKSTHEKFSEALGKNIDGLSGIFKDGGSVGFGRLMKELFEKVDAKRDGKI